MTIPSPLPKKAPLILTDAARARLYHLLHVRNKPSLGIRIGVNAKGCSGLQYTLTYADDKKPTDEEMVDGDVTLFIDSQALLFILGTRMDFVEDNVQSGFRFDNPNEKGKCGCGKSFHV